MCCSGGVLYVIISESLLHASFLFDIQLYSLFKLRYIHQIVGGENYLVIQESGEKIRGLYC
jgi:hypothetical protein